MYNRPSVDIKTITPRLPTLTQMPLHLLGVENALKNGNSSFLGEENRQTNQEDNAKANAKGYKSKAKMFASSEGMRPGGFQCRLQK